MPKITAQVKADILELSRKDLEKLVIKAASSNKQFYNFMIVNYTHKTDGEQMLFEQAKADLDVLFVKPYKGHSQPLQLTKMLAACNKRIIEFGKICKDKSLELDLILYTLEIPFSLPPKILQTGFKRLHQKIYALLKKAITLLTTKMHEDYHLQYASTINGYLEILHDHSYLDSVNKIPQSI
jgi:hypothetical protein